MNEKSSPGQRKQAFLCLADLFLALVAILKERVSMGTPRLEQGVHT